MSLDIWLSPSTKCPQCGGPLPRIEGDTNKNYTHNVNGMWRKAEVYDALYNSHGWTVTRAYVAMLDQGIADMENYPAKYIAMNPPNGWGSYETALPWLKDWRNTCARNIGAEIGLSK